MSVTIDDEIRILNLTKYEKEKYEKQQKALAKVPPAIYVTLIDRNYYSHSGRSRMAKRDPYAFHKDKPVLITEPEDVRYFMGIAKKGNMFVFTIAEDYSEEEEFFDEEEEEIEDKEFLSEIEEQKAKVEAIEKAKAAEEKVKAQEEAKVQKEAEKEQKAKARARAKKKALKIAQKEKGE